MGMRLKHGIECLFCQLDSRAGGRPGTPAAWATLGHSAEDSRSRGSSNFSQQYPQPHHGMYVTSSGVGTLLARSNRTLSSTPTLDCKTYNAFYVEATASMPSFCVCLTGFLLDGTTNACIPVRPSGPVLSPGTIAGIVIGSVVGLGLIGGLLFYLGQRRGKTKAKKASASGATEAQALATAGARTGSSDPGIEMAAPLNFDPSAPPLSVLDEPSGPALEELEEAEAAAMLVNEAPTAMSAARPTVMPSAPPDHEALLVPGTLGSGLAAVAAVSATAPPSNSPPPMAPPRTVSAPPAAVDPILADPPPPPYTEMDPHAVVMNAPSPASVPPAAAPTVPVETVTAQAPSGGAATITPSLAAAAAAVTAPPRTDTAPLIVQEVAAPPRVSSVAGPGTDGAMVGVTELPKPLHMVAHKTFTVGSFTLT